ncbi:Phototropic-responsive NPH3 family protein [Zea mays]|uniref:Phototropic-responsive NPH3 family protein n=1 Tax=Zea mays TaxID=4577 RepID=A0A1D6GVY3_MAIZE|nr:Phototropic-responsive NPH3 family protein [Zea mays]
MTSLPQRPPERPVVLHYLNDASTAKSVPDVAPPTSSSASGRFLPPESPTTTWLKKRLLLSPSWPRSLRIRRRAAAAVAPRPSPPTASRDAGRRGDTGVRPRRRARAGAALDVPLVLRLVRGFLKEGGGGSKAARVARLVDVYLAEAALEAGLRPAEFEELARAVPAHARPADDALYRAVDTYLKVRPRSALS